MHSPARLLAALSMLAAAQPVLADAAGDWMIVFAGPKDAASRCRFTQSLLDVSGSVATITIPTADGDTLVGRADLETTGAQTTTIRFKMFSGEDVTLDGVYGDKSANGAWTSGSLSCQGTWSATRRD